ncbi:hypothetical protein MtrunA17_Chr4g0013901 [Medicago truncatula]|uniref:Transmembrane protein n=1 Tax=Medicago truncatula TaxID=3880 RepID=A0A396I761_MEDTR|nr:hypothetical protein MtrunA17_Chr4g0013901 [Medicago truncatula]
MIWQACSRMDTQQGLVRTRCRMFLWIQESFTILWIDSVVLLIVQTCNCCI